MLTYGALVESYWQQETEVADKTLSGRTIVQQNSATDYHGIEPELSRFIRHLAYSFRHSVVPINNSSPLTATSLCSVQTKPLYTPTSHHSHSHSTFFLYSFSHFHNESLVTNRKWTPRSGFIFNRLNTTFESCIPPEYLCTRQTIIPVHLSHHFHRLCCSFPDFKTEFTVRSPLHAATVTTSSHYLHNMVPYFPSCSAWGVAVLPDYKCRLVTLMACIAS